MGLKHPPLGLHFGSNPRSPSAPAHHCHLGNRDCPYVFRESFLLPGESWPTYCPRDVPSYRGEVFPGGIGAAHQDSREIRESMFSGLVLLLRQIENVGPLDNMALSSGLAIRALLGRAAAIL